MGGLQVFVFDADADEARPWDLDGEPPTERVEFLALRRTLRALRELAPRSASRVVLTDRLNGRLPLAGSDVAVVCLNDEASRPPSYASHVAIVFKLYGERRPILPQLRGIGSAAELVSTVGRELRVQRVRAPSLLRRAASPRSRRVPIIDLPLGPLVDVDVAPVPWDQRRIDISFMGSLINLADTGRWVRMSPKLRSRQELLAMIQQISDWPHPPTVCTALRADYHDSQHFHTDYARALANTRIAPCPRGGWSLETYRFFEAMSFGCIVVAEALPDRDYYSGAPVVHVRRWSQLPGLVRDLLNAPDEMLRLHQATESWWRERCSPAATAARMVQALRAAG